MSTRGKRTATVGSAAEREPEMLQMYRDGKTLSDIAIHFKVSTVAVYQQFERIRKRWARDNNATYEMIVGERAWRIQETMNMALEDFIKSRESTEYQQVGVGPKGGKIVEAVKVPNGQPGDPRFLEIVLKCTEQLNRLQGVYKSDGTPINEIQNWNVILAPLLNGDGKDPVKAKMEQIEQAAVDVTPEEDKESDNGQTDDSTGPNSNHSDNGDGE